MQFSGMVCDFCNAGTRYTQEVRRGYYQEIVTQPQFRAASASHTIVLDGKRIRLDLCGECEKDFQRVCYVWERNGTVIDQPVYTNQYAKVDIVKEEVLQPPKKVNKLVCPKCGF